jgi:hypothetical protein
LWAAALVGGRVGWGIDVLRGSCDSVSWGHVGAGSAVEVALKIYVANPRDHACPSNGAGWRGRQEVVVVVGEGGGKAGVVVGWRPRLVGGVGAAGNP